MGTDNDLVDLEGKKMQKTEWLWFEHLFFFFFIQLKWGIQTKIKALTQLFALLKYGAEIRFFLSP